MNELKNKNEIENFSQLSKFPHPDGQSILVCPLGGVAQIGMNWTLYGFDGSWVLVDAGSLFAPRDLSIVQAIFPDPEILADIAPKLKGLVITHAHEDHIGAVHRIWPEFINCPIYATPFASSCLNARFVERGTDREVTMFVFEPGDTISIGSFSIETIPVTHSVPECVALAFKTPIGTVLHTGDWKFDPEPLIGKPTDLNRIKALGNEGILALVCDSTNADRPHQTTSEADVAQGFAKVFQDAKGLVVVSCFSTNIARVASAMKAAAATGREVAISGSSMIKNVRFARELGLLDNVPEPLARASHLNGLEKRNMALICTGAQGESNATLARLSRGDDYRLPELGYEDVVVHSARVIPGNEGDLNEVLDGIKMAGADILSDRYEGLSLHVTGHATSGELTMMYELTKPKFSIPVHGTPRHLEAHAKIARAYGVAEVVKPDEGAVFEVFHGGIRVVAKVHVHLKAELDDSTYTKLDWDEESIRADIASIQKEPYPRNSRQHQVPAKRA